MNGAGLLEHHLIAQAAADLHRQRLVVEVVGFREIGLGRLEIVLVRLFGQRVGKVNDHAGHILLARRRQEAVGLRLVNDLGLLVIALLHEGVGLEEAPLMVPRGVLVVCGQLIARGNAGVVLLAVKLRERLEIRGLVHAIAPGGNHLVQRHHGQLVFLGTQRGLTGLEVGIHLRIRAQAALAHRKHAEKKSEET